MKTHAIRIHEAGGPDVLRWEEIDVGDPGQGEVLVRNEAVGSTSSMSISAAGSTRCRCRSSAAMRVRVSSRRSGRGSMASPLATASPTLRRAPMPSGCCGLPRGW